jgi:hypothetical protein
LSTFRSMTGSDILSARQMFNVSIQGPVMSLFRPVLKRMETGTGGDYSLWLCRVPEANKMNGLQAVLCRW